MVGPGLLADGPGERPILVRPPLFFLLLLLLATGPETARAQPAPGAEAFGAWSHAALKEQGLPFFSGLLEMGIEADEGGHVVFTTRATARFLGARIAMSETRSTLDPATGRSLRYTDRNKKTARRYVFGDQGYSIQKLDPVNGPDRSLDEWKVYFEKHYPYPDDGDGGQLPVYDYYGMLLYLRRTALAKPGDAITVYLATSDGPMPYRISVAEVRPETVTYKSKAIGARRTATVRALRLHVAPGDPARADEGFLKMEGETEMWVEAASKTLLSLSGKVPHVGRIRLVLAEMD